MISFWIDGSISILSLMKVLDVIAFVFVVVVF